MKHIWIECRAAVTISAAQRKGLRVAIVEKAATIRSGAGGPGGDHWDYPMTCHLMTVSPEEQCKRIIESYGGYCCGIGRDRHVRESYHAFLELEPMGGKIRDTENEYAGCWGRDEKTKTGNCREVSAYKCLSSLLGIES